MSKKTNTVFFIIGATVFNIIVTIVSFLVLLVVYSSFFYPRLPDNSAPWALPIIFVFSITASFLLYRLAFTFFMKKVEFEKHFEPLIRPRRTPRR